MNMKQTTRLHDFFHPMIMFHIMGWKKSMRVRVIVASRSKAFETMGMVSKGAIANIVVTM
jgi:hypothetical protein